MKENRKRFYSECSAKGFLLLLHFCAFALLLHCSCAGRVDVKSPTGSISGLASWYGREFQGRHTASGEKFDAGKYTAAHRTLPFNTVVRVENLKNGREVEVRINDRGPFIDGRIIDLSQKAAEKLDMIREGVVPVRILVLR